MESIFLQFAEFLPVASCLFLFACLLLAVIRSASNKHHLLITTFTLVLLLPWLQGIIPDWRVLPRLDLSLEEVSGPVIATNAAWSSFGLSLLAGVWVLGIAWVVFKLGFGLFKLKTMARSSRPAGRQLQETLRTVTGELEVDAPIQLRCGGSARMPLVWGWRHPVILLPSEAEEWRDDELEIVLAHEVAHLKRHDMLSNLLRQLALSLYWFHPLMVALARRQVLLREMACDDHVVLTGRDPYVYAKKLADIVTSGGVKHSPTLACGLSEESTLRKRLVSLLDSGQQRSRIAQRHLVLGSMPMVAFGILITSLGIKAAAEYSADRVALISPISQEAPPVVFSLWEDLVEPVFQPQDDEDPQPQPEDIAFSEMPALPPTALPALPLTPEVSYHEPVESFARAESFPAEVSQPRDNAMFDERTFTRTESYEQIATPPWERAITLFPVSPRIALPLPFTSPTPVQIGESLFGEPAFIGETGWSDELLFAEGAIPPFESGQVEVLDGDLFLGSAAINLDGDAFPAGFYEMGSFTLVDDLQDGEGIRVALAELDRQAFEFELDHGEPLTALSLIEDDESMEIELSDQVGSDEWHEDRSSTKSYTFSQRTTEQIGSQLRLPPISNPTPGLYTDEEGRSYQAISCDVPASFPLQMLRVECSHDLDYWDHLPLEEFVYTRTPVSQMIDRVELIRREPISERAAFLRVGSEMDALEVLVFEEIVPKVIKD